MAKRDIGKLLAEYDELTKSISGMTEAKKGVHGEIMAYLRETGENVDGVEAGGYRASVSYRSYTTFNDKGQGGEPLSGDALTARLMDLRRFFGKFAPELDIPASDKIGKAYEAFLAATGPHPDDCAPPLPPFLKKSLTPVLRVSGSAIATPTVEKPDAAE